MRTLIRRRDVLTSGTLAVAGSVLATRGSPRLADASEAPGPPAGTESSLGANRTLEALHQSLNPFKFIVYSEWAGTGLAPVQ
jgi:hypothetical protein